MIACLRLASDKEQQVAFAVRRRDPVRTDEFRRAVTVDVKRREILVTQRLQRGSGDFLLREFFPYQFLDLTSFRRGRPSPYTGGCQLEAAARGERHHLLTQHHCL